MTVSRIFLWAGALLALVFLNAASAQTISIVSGQGQLICDGCVQPNYSFFDNVVVLVTDANGTPLPNVTVTWALASDGIQPPNSSLISGSTTTTGNNTSANAGPCDKIGQTCNRYPGSDTGGRVLRTMTVTASLANAQSVTFTLTETPQPSNGGTIQNALVTVLGPAPNTLFQGTAGATSSSTIQIQATAGGVGIPNVSFRLVPDPSSSAGGPTVTCVTGTNADPGSVLTGSDGIATCTPVFGPVPNTGQPPLPVIFFTLIGGVMNPQFPQNQLNGPGVPAGFAEPLAGRFNLIVTPATPAFVQIISGDKQSANRGQAFALPLVVKVVDGNSPPNALPSAPVTWSILPVGAAVITQSTSPTDANGQASANVLLTNNAGGLVQVTATTANGKTATFSLSVNVQVTGLTKGAGDNQSVSVGQLFQPVSVQVSTSTGASLAGINLQFAVASGSASVTQPSATTDANGRAAVGVQAGNSSGPVTVTASVGNFSVTFNLTVLPPGLSLTSANFLNAAGFFPTGEPNFGALSPCSIGTVVVGLPLTSATLPAVPALFGAAIQQPSGASVVFNPTGSVANPPGAAPESAPILFVSGANTAQALITFQVPCDLIAGALPVSVTLNNATTITPVILALHSASPGIFELPMSDGVRRAVAVKQDGSFVSLENKARRSEIIRIYITGIGPTSPPLVTGALPNQISGVNSVSTAEYLAVRVNGAGVAVLPSSQVSPSLLGVFEVDIMIPADAPVGPNTSLELAVLVAGNDSNYQYANPGVPSKIPIQ